VALLLVTQFAATGYFLNRTLREPDRLAWFLHGDTDTYLGIAHRFLGGDFSMSFVAKRPHRVPLFPACLALGLRFSHDSVVGLAAVNIVIGCLIVAMVYFATLWLFKSRLVAALLGMACLANSFLFEFNTQRLMTEPLFILLAGCAAYFFVAYVRHQRARDLCFMSLFSSLSYLTRVNGLFVILTMFGVLFVFDLMRLLKGHRTGLPRAIAEVLVRHGVAFLLALLFTAPNWWPRWHYFGNPIADGYPTNFLWVDTFEQGTTGLPYPTYGLKDYTATHTLHDFLTRWKIGIYRVYMTVPIRTEAIAIQYWLAVAGVLIALVCRKVEFILLAAVMIVVLLPSAWTYLSDPMWRISYSSILPFEFLFAAVALDFGIGKLNRLCSSTRPPEGPGQ